MANVMSVVTMNKTFKKCSLICMCLLLAGTLLGCTSSNTDWPEHGKVPVVASFYPVAFLTQQVGGDKVDVLTMVPAGAEPHVWEPTPSDLVNIGKSKLFVYLGLGMDAWAPDVLQSLGKDAPESVEASDGVDPLTFEQEREMVAGHDDSENHDHDHDDEHIGHSHSHGGVDPHVWLDPQRAKIMAKNILDGLSSVDPDNKSYYEENYRALALRLDELDQAYETNLSGFKEKKIVVSHEAYGYICARYGIDQIGISGLTPDSEPDAKTMSEIVNLVKKDHITTVFYEELVSPKVAKQIASETGAKAEVLSPVEGLSEDDIQAGENYFTKMYNNLEKLKVAFKHE